MTLSEWKGTEMGRIESEKLASMVESQTGTDDVFDTAIPSIKLSRFSAPSELSALVYEPCLCIVAQGAKEVVLAGDSYRLDPAQSLLVSVDLPVEARVVEATADCPYLGIASHSIRQLWANFWPMARQSSHWVRLRER